ncbi:MAG: ABC transporter ATP-binding protein [Tissierellia bacterium]|nr:ABC transporter ATP-binding protein [Tissierellia bacterium]
MLEIKNLNFSYNKGQKALNNINLKADKGKIIGIIGENGAGKSTLFLNILGILKPANGEIYLDGEKLSYEKKYLKKYREKVNMVLQDPDKQIFYSHVYDDLAFALKNMKLPKEEIDLRIEKVSKQLGIENLLDKAVHYLSYGQKKRVAIAGVLSMEPEVLLLDEPTAGLDPNLTRQMIKLISDLKLLGKTVLISSHDMDFIYNICDYVYIMHKGEILTKGHKENVFLDEKLIYKANLEPPTLVRIHLNSNLPLCETEEELYKLINN